jgi:GAF domain-containing protein
VLDTIVETAARLCNADYSQIMRARDDGTWYAAALFGHSTEYAEYLKHLNVEPGRGSITGRALLTGKPIQIADVMSDPDYELHEAQRIAGYRTHLGVPLSRKGQTLGMIILSRKKVTPFSAKEIELVETFADQAVIAIENTRLFEEVQARTRELTQSLEYQTATSEVLDIISRSKFELQPVFDAIVESGLKLFSGAAVAILLPDGAR